jgi:transcriptional regulator with XRE-family HTH domain
VPAPAKTVKESFAEQLEGVRRRKGWTQQQLADRMETMGLPLDRSAIAKIETQRRAVSLEEALAFAAALGVSPAALVVPRDETMLQLAPQVPWWIPSETAWDWFAGRHPARSVGPLEDPSYRMNEDGTPDPSSVIALGERLLARERFFFSEVADAEAESIRLLPGVQEVYVRACVVKTYARHVVTDGREPGSDKSALLSYLRRELAYLAEDVATEIRKLDRVEADYGEH